MTQKIDLLDHGYVRLVSYMQPVPVLSEDYQNIAREGWTGDLEIVRNARTSYNADWRTGEDADKDRKLMNRLWTLGHSTPFESMAFTFEVQAPIFVFRQWHRSRTWSYNETSARYTELPDLYYVPRPEHIGKQSAKDKQGRDTDVDLGWAEDKQQYIRSASKLAYDNYQYLLKSGVSRELARIILPVNMYSRMFGTVNLRNLFHFFALRLDGHAQYEIRVYAEAMLELVEPICPVAVEEFIANPRPGVTKIP